MRYWYKSESKTGTKVAAAAGSDRGNDNLTIKAASIQRDKAIVPLAEQLELCIRLPISIGLLFRFQKPDLQFLWLTKNVLKLR